MKKVIMITGHLAALKSTVATRLGKDLNIIVFCKDKIKEILGDTIGFKTRDENLKLSEATFKLMVDDMQQTLLVHDEVILESNFRTYEVEEIQERCRLLDAKLIVVFLTGKSEVLYQRYLERQPLRHKVHTSTGTLDLDTFEIVMKPFDPSLYGEQALIVDTSSFNESDYQELLTILKNRMA
ncbi:MAG: hypothetical protein KKH01_01150 [Firmicutes bacterium]|nr:hypothetical protein [Bacillota bacterium]